MSEPVRVRFPPSPTGDLHVGNVRSALFNYAFARHNGGAFVLRIEDTDLVRSTEASYRGLLDDLRWLGLDWDEGPEAGGPYGPYRQSERGGLYADVAARLHDAGFAYPCYCTPAEVEARTKAAGRPPGYDGHCRDLSEEQRAAYDAEGRSSVLRFRMPDEAITFTDLIRGPVRFEPEHVPDYVLVRSDDSPLYTLTNPTDDATQRISHVLRGEDLLSSTPRQIPLHRALRELGLTDAPMPEFGHLPFVLGEGNQRLSKRKTPEASLQFVREQGYLPEAVLNYLALLGWSFGDDRELFSLDEMCRAFSLERVNANPARFDARKLQAINGIKVRELSPADFIGRIAPFLERAELIANPPTDAQRQLLQEATPLIQERVNLLGDAVPMLDFLLVDEDRFAIDPDAAAKQLQPESLPTLQAAQAALAGVEEWTADNLQDALRTALVDGLGLKPRRAFGPVRVAVTGRTVSPPLFESVQILGRPRTTRRLSAAIDSIRAE
jgi:glutamyl-tRNA synthetase